MDFLEALQLNRGCILYHRTLTNADGTPQRWKVNGRVRTWKTMPTRIEIPIKRGLYQYDRITEIDLANFEVRNREY